MPIHSMEQLVHSSWHDLEQIYRQSEAGTIPRGYARGRAIYCPDSLFSRARSKLAGLVWQGKDFHASEGMLVNQWRGVKAIKARVSYGPSWLDGKPSIIMDYCGTSRVWADVRDEIREVAPGLYLGAMYQRRSPQAKFKMYFALDANVQEECRH